MTLTSPTLIVQLDNPFWRFSLAVYQNKAVKKACLAFQDEKRANVNVLLFCCWLAFAVEEVSQTDFLEASHLIDNWHHQVTEPLRNTRRWVKALKDKDPWVDEFCQQLVMDELVSETYQQFLLFSCFEKRQKIKMTKNEALAMHYLCWIFSDLGHPIDRQLKAELATFVTNIFSMVTPS